MRIFKSALRVALRHPVYLGTYLLLLSLLGVFLTGNIVADSDEDGVYEREQASIAIIDRDGSTLSSALAAHLETTQEVIAVADEPFALQDALATGLVDAVIIVPGEYGEEVLSAARADSDTELPSFDVAYGNYTQASALAEQDASRWVSLAAAVAALEPAADQARVVALTAGAVAERAQTDVASLSAVDNDAAPLQAYLGLSTYTITCSVVVCAGLLLSRLSEREVRRRTSASPVRPWRFSASTFAACSCLTVGVWALTGAIGVVSSGVLAAGVGIAQVALALAAMLVFSFVPLSLAFLLSQVGFGEAALNAFANIGGMLMAFMGGAWVSLAMLGDAVQAAARFAPTYWTLDAISCALSASEITPEVLMRCAQDVGITALFAVVLALLGLVVGRLR